MSGLPQAALDRLHAAHALASAGRYAEALQEHLWFHEHALDEGPALTGVRLSFALAYWVQLGSAYPEALAALKAVRDRAAASVRSGTAPWDVFHDVAAINRELGCADQTYALFRELAASDEALARRCYPVALDAILAARDFALAQRFLGDPAQEIRLASAHLNHTVRLRRQWQYSPAPRIKAEIGIYAASARQALDVLEGCGRLAEARALHALAVRLIQATTVRAAVCAALRPGARPWHEQELPRAARRRRAPARRT